MDGLGSDKTGCGYQSTLSAILGGEGSIKQFGLASVSLFQGLRRQKQDFLLALTVFKCHLEVTGFLWWANSMCLCTQECTTAGQRMTSLTPLFPCDVCIGLMDGHTADGSRRFPARLAGPSYGFKDA